MLIGVVGKSGAGKSSLIRRMMSFDSEIIHIDIDKIGHSILSDKVVMENIVEIVEDDSVVKAMLEAIYGTSPYKSPTEMGVNMVGFAISDEEVACDASNREIIRRYLNSLLELRNGKIKKESCDKIALLMRKLNINVSDRKCVAAALKKRDESNTVSMAMELTDGTIITSKTSDLLSAPAALILNALKYLAGINDDLILISPTIIEPISSMKINILGNNNPRLHVDEVLIALTISARTNPLAELAIKELPSLRNCEAHSTVIMASIDSEVFKKLGINLTCEPEVYAKKLYYR